MSWEELTISLGGYPIRDLRQIVKLPFRSTRQLSIISSIPKFRLELSKARAVLIVEGADTPDLLDAMRDVDDLLRQRSARWLPYLPERITTLCLVVGIMVSDIPYGYFIRSFTAKHHLSLYYNIFASFILFFPLYSLAYGFVSAHFHVTIGLADQPSRTASFFGKYGWNLASILLSGIVALLVQIIVHLSFPK